MKKFLALALSCVMALSLLAGCGGGSTSTPDASSGSSASGEKIVKIGIFEPATGDSASGGKKEMLGYKYANLETPTVEVGGETYKVELVYADNGSDVSKAPTAAAQLVSEGVAMVLGSYGSGVSMAAGPIFGDAGLVAMGVTCTNPNVTAGNDYYYRMCFLDPFQGTVLANFAQDKFAAQTAYLLGEQGNEYDQGIMAFFEQAFTAAGGTVIKDSFPKGNSDFTTYLNKAKNENVDLIFIPVSIAYATQIVSQAAKLGMEIPFLGSDTMDDNKVLEAVRDTNIQLYVSTFYQEGGSESFDQGIKEYINANADAKADNGGDDTIAAVTAMGYDAYYVALEALKLAGSVDPAAVKGALGNVVYEGVTGPISFDEIGDANRDTAYIKVFDNASGNWALETVQSVG